MRPDPLDPASRMCRTCRYWNALSLDMLKGDCMAPDNHRYWRHTTQDGTRAMLDSFGKEETAPSYGCGRHEAPPQESAHT